MLAIIIMTLLVPAILLIQWLALRNRRRLTQDTSTPPVILRTASLDTSIGNERTWRFAMLSTLLPLLSTVVLLAIRWNTIPTRFPRHWGFNGQPDGWSNRTVSGVFFPLIAAFVTIGILGLLGELTQRSSPGHEGRSTLVGSARTVLAACAWLMVVILGAVGLLPLAHNSTNLVPILVTGTLVLTVAIVAYTAFHFSRIRPAIEAGKNVTHPRFWKAGLIYYNRQDSALMVPKLSGLGYTLNFGRPVSWLILGVLVVGVLLTLALHWAAGR